MNANDNKAVRACRASNQTESSMSKQMRLRANPLRAAVAVALAGGMAFGGQAMAAEFNWGELQGNWDNSINAGISFRAEERDPDNVGKANNLGFTFAPPDFTGYRPAREVQGRFSVNGDQGNLAYDQWDVFENSLSWTSELSLTYKNMGAFFRTYASRTLKQILAISTPAMLPTKSFAISDCWMLTSTRISISLAALPPFVWVAR
jgi:hypothetical protein